MKRKHLFFLIIPIAYLVLEYFKFPLISHYYSASPDPTYIYLMNGLNIAEGNWELGHYDNPGTPLHILTGFMLWFIHLFSGQGDIVDDVIMNPEFYLKRCISILFFIKALTLFFVGYKISRITKSLFIGLGFQLIPLFILERLSCPGLINPDLLLDILSLLFVAYLFPILYRQNQPISYKETALYVAPLALIVGAIAATKISSIGLVFVPLLVFAGWRSKALFLITCVGGFFLFTLPVLSRLDEFLNFIMGIATHKGQYGTGEVGFITLVDFTNNVYRLYSREITLILTYLISLIAGSYFSIKRSNIWGFLLLGIAFAYTFQTIVIGKHFSYHYTLPMHYLFILTLFSFAKLLKDEGYLNWMKNKKWIISLGLLLFFVVGVTRAFNHNIFKPYASTKMIATDSFLRNRIQPTLFFPGKGNSTSSYVQPALWFGKLYSGYTTRWDRAIELEDAYPSSYFYNISNEKIEDWNTVIPFWMICKQHNLLDVYVRDQSYYDVKKIIRNKLKKWSWPDTVISINNIYQNKASKEAIYQLTINKEWFSTNYVAIFKKVMTFDGEQKKHLFVSKNNSKPMKLTMVEVMVGDFVTASIWRKSANKKCFIEFRGHNGYYDHTGYITNRKGPWEKITITYEVSQENEGPLDITIRNVTNNSAFFDDLEISIVRQLKK